MAVPGGAGGAWGPAGSMTGGAGREGGAGVPGTVATSEVAGAGGTAGPPKYAPIIHIPNNKLEPSAAAANTGRRVFIMVSCIRPGLDRRARL
jgi:hypothetical protein